MDGEWLLDFAGSCGHSTIMYAELLAIYHGLVLALAAGYMWFVRQIRKWLCLWLMRGLSKSTPMLLLSTKSEVFVLIHGDYPSSILFVKGIFVPTGLLNLEPTVIVLSSLGESALRSLILYSLQMLWGLLGLDSFFLLFCCFPLIKKRYRNMHLKYLIFIHIKVNLNFYSMIN